jgi:hypothetical protein
MGKYSKNLIDPDALKPISEAANAARTIHYEQSLPWSDDGKRILPAANFLPYSELMRDARRVFEERVNYFIARYDTLVDAAKIALNGLFDPRQYPSAHELNNKFYFEVSTDVLPTSQDFRVDLDRGTVEAIRAEIEGRTQATVKEAQRDLWTRLQTTVGNMAESLKVEDKIFRDSLVSNVRQIVDLIPRLSLEDDPELDAIRAHVAATLATKDPETLRKNKTIRKQTADEAAAILQKMAGYTG